MAGRSDKSNNNAHYPKEFFYGSKNFQSSNIELQYINSRPTKLSRKDKLLSYFEYIQRRIFGVGPENVNYRLLAAEFNSTDIVISFTDSLSLTLGFNSAGISPKPFVCGGFHGLSDRYENLPQLLKRRAKRYIKCSTQNLDHIFFFGDKDRTRASDLFDIPLDKTSLFQFGVDTDFWGGIKENKKTGTIFSAGSDYNRDYHTLLKTNFSGQFSILSDNKFINKFGKDKFNLINGSLHKSRITDLELREIYNQSEIVVVPIKNVYQPSGYSVVLQAMASGCAVILTNFIGLWDRELFVNYENCILVPPHNSEAISVAIKTLQENDELRRKISINSKKTAKKYFSLNRMDKSFQKLVNLSIKNNV